MSEGYYVDAKKVASAGYLHLLRAPFRAAAARGNRTSPECTVSVWCHGGCSAGTILVAAFTAVARRTICYWCDTLITHRALTS
jgi:hypothetical protein